MMGAMFAIPDASKTVGLFNAAQSVYRTEIWGIWISEKRTASEIFQDRSKIARIDLKINF